ncbi:MAG: adenylate/guanylate cyclase domain-containing protein [Candidatus Competibacteraceae bacterium]|nr:adenylate/guanylate cyclase domain-containing protein [Candidatus Competibacteraceae bacterium]
MNVLGDRLDQYTAQPVLWLGAIAALLGILANIVLSALPLDLQTDLDWLFKLRGPRPAPDEVVIIGIDQGSAEQLGLPEVPKPWPRSQHAQLVNKLTDQGAGVIIFDMYFEESRNTKHDRLFAQSLLRAGNVVLFSRLDKRRIVNEDKSSLILFTEQQRVPITELTQAAAGWAPFPLPKAPATVNSFWLFKEELNGTPTLPVLAFQEYALQRCDATVLRAVADPSIAERPINPLSALSKTLRAQFQLDSQRTPTLLEKRLRQTGDVSCTQAILTALVDMYRGGNWRYLDFYGPATSIKTVSYQRALREPLDVTGKAVFVGLLDPTLETREDDSFQSAFSQGNAALFGVEIAATAFANLLENRRVWTLPPPWYPLPVIVWGMLLGLLIIKHSPTFAIGLASGLIVTYLGLAWWLFDRNGLWLPLIVPLLIQAPCALGLVLWRTGRHTRQVLDAIMPSKIAEHSIANPTRIGAYQRHIDGICLATDIAGYTKVAERLTPHELKALKDAYLSLLIAAVNHHNGSIVDMAGDAMIAVWDNANEVAHRRQACETALEILAATRQFNRDKLPALQLPIRIGIHHGAMTLGNIGAHNRYQYSAVGDPVGTATRIQDFGKQLGVQLLVSQPILSDLDELISREVGQFRLVGKTQALRLYEVQGKKGTDEVAIDEYDLYTQFDHGLKIFREQCWDKAQVIFSSLVARHQDGPSDYYQRLCRTYMADPPPEPWDGVVEVKQKQ